MNCHTLCVLLAETAHFSLWQNILADDRQHLLLAAAGLGAVAVVAIFVWAGRRIISARRGRRAFHNPNKLFEALCGAHGLDRPSRRLLRRLARSLKLEHPGSLFVEPERFDVGQLPMAVRRHEARLTVLRNRLFEDSGERGA